MYPNSTTKKKKKSFKRIYFVYKHGIKSTLDIFTPIVFISGIYFFLHIYKHLLLDKIEIF